jgi:hypothetical protein
LDRQTANGPAFSTHGQFVAQGGMSILKQNFANSCWPLHWGAIRRVKSLLDAAGDADLMGGG